MSSRSMRIAALVGVVLAAGVTFASAAGLTVQRPSVTLASGQASVPLETCTVTPSADAYISELSNALNFGSVTSAFVTSSAVAGNRRLLVRFDLASCSIPAQAEVVGATMRLTLLQVPLVQRTYLVHRMADTWNESTVTWNTRPPVAASTTATASAGVLAQSDLVVDVAADVQAFVAGTATNHGWRLRDETEGALTTQESEIATREAPLGSSRPRLEVSWYP